MSTARDKLAPYIIDEEIKKKLLDLLKRLVNCLDKLGIEYWLDGGSLLGLYRHGGMIPWDEDIDIGIQLCDEDKLLEGAELLSSLGIGLKKNRTGAYWQVDNNVGDLQHVLNPFLHIDIFLYESDGDFLYNTDIRFRDSNVSSGHCNMVYDKSLLYPLAEYKFDTLFVKSPACIKEILDMNLGEGYMRTAIVKSRHSSNIFSIDLEDKSIQRLIQRVYHL